MEIESFSTMEPLKNSIDAKIGLDQEFDNVKSIHHVDISNEHTRNQIKQLEFSFKGDVDIINYDIYLHVRPCSSSLKKETRFTRKK